MRGGGNMIKVNIVNSHHPPFAFPGRLPEQPAGLGALERIPQKRIQSQHREYRDQIPCAAVRPFHSTVQRGNHRRLVQAVVHAEHCVLLQGTRLRPEGTGGCATQEGACFLCGYPMQLRALRTGFPLFYPQLATLGLLLFAHAC